jgi:asparagine synthase (glutamine-hydrolysing)
MCGIAGIASAGLVASGEAARIVAAMLARMRHRGPDGEGVLAERDVALGAVRLAVIDTRPVAQPLVTTDGRYAIAYNGEVYRHRALRDELEAKGAHFATQTDTEVVAEAFREWGADALPRLHGMFAFVILDRETGELFGARDRLGKKPLFLHETAALLAFGSHLPSLALVPGVSREIDPRSLLDTVELGWVHGPRTILRDVHQLPPGHAFHYRSGELRTFRWWDLAWHFVAGTQQGAAEHDRIASELEGALGDAVEDRLVADVRVASLLSGGLDSTTVAALMRERAKGPVTTVTVGFDEPGFDESAHATEAARFLGTDHHVERLSLEDERALVAVQERVGEPLGDTSVLPTALAFEAVSRHATVALTGDGADELFAGYETYRADRLHGIVSRLPSWPLRPLARAAAALVPATDGKVSFAYRARRFAAGLDLPPAEAHASWRALRDEAGALDALTPDARAAVAGYSPMERFRELDARVAACDRVNRASYVDLMTYLPDDILVKADRASMAWSVEARCPFLDTRVVERAARLPGRFKLRGATTKWILREQQRERLPPATLRRRKEGFSSPVARWLAGPLRERFLDSATASRLAPLGLDARRVRELHAALEQRSALPGYALWAIHVLLLWDELR